MPFSERTTPLAFAWGAIESATAARAGTAEVFQAIRDAAESQGIPLPPLSLQAVNEMRAQAVAIRNASERFSRADPATAVLSDYIAQAPWSRDLGAQAASPTLQVRFQHSTTDEAGNSLTAWRTVMIPGGADGTIQSVLDEIEAGAEALADEYQVTHAGISAVQLLAV